MHRVEDLGPVLFTDFSAVSLLDVECGSCFCNGKGGVGWRESRPESINYATKKECV